MSRALMDLRAAQIERESVIVPEARPMGQSVLDWCDAHPEEVAYGKGEQAVASLRMAMTQPVYVFPYLYEVWFAVPGSADAAPCQRNWKRKPTAFPTARDASFVIKAPPPPVMQAAP